MAHSTVVLLISIGLVALVLAMTALHWRRMHSPRTLLQGLGVALVVAALQVIGFMEVVYTWARSTIHWVLHTPFDSTRWIGVGIGALGVILFLVATLITPVSRADAKQRRLAQRQSTAQVGVGNAAAATPTASAAGGAGRPGARPATAPAATASAPQAGSTRGSAPASGDEDAEIEAILRSHGIQ